MNKKIKTLIIGMVIIALFAMMAISANAEAPTIKLVSQDSITGNVVIAVKAGHDESVKIYKKIGENITLINTVIGNGETQEYLISFNELDCKNKTEVSIFAENENNIKSGYVTVDAHGPHDLGNWTTIKATGCTENGTAGRKCTVCGQVLETKSMPATGHNWGEPTWTWAKDYSSCTAIFTCKKDSSHTSIHTVKNVTVTKTVNATCISAGSKTYSVSFGFGGETYSTSKTVTVPKTSHTLSDWIVSKAPTCTTAGTRVKKCTACRDIITTESIPALGHNYTITYKWTNNNTMCTATAICSRDKSHIQTETVKGLDKIVKQASCIVAGKLTRTATFTNPLFKPQTKTASITGSHVDANKDNICDVCHMNLKTVTTTKAETTTQSRNLFDKLFNNDDKTTTTTAPSSTEAPTEMITSYKFDDPTTGQTITHPDIEKETSNKPPVKIVAILVAVIAVSAIGAVICIIMLKKDKKDAEKHS